MELRRMSTYKTTGRKGWEANLEKKTGVNLNVSWAALFTD